MNIRSPHMKEIHNAMKVEVGQVWKFHYRDEDADDYLLILCPRTEKPPDSWWAMCLYSSDHQVDRGRAYAVVFDDKPDEFTFELIDIATNPIPGWP